MLRRIRSTSNTSPPPWQHQELRLRRAEKHIRRGQLQRAIDDYRAMVADDPDDLASLNRIGDLLVRTAELDKGIGIFLQVARRYHDDGFFAKATAIYRKVLRFDPLQGEARRMLTELYRRRRLPVPLFAPVD